MATSKKGKSEVIDDPELRVSVGKKIRKLREMQGMTQVDLATQLGMTSTGAISQVENGTKGLKMTSLIKAAKVFGISPIVLLDPGDFGEDELKAFQEFMEFIKAKQRDPSVVGPSLRAIRSMMSEYVADPKK